MTKLKLILFTIQQFSELGLWQAGAEMCGGDVRRARASAHRRLAAAGCAALMPKPSEDAGFNAQEQGQL